VYRQSDNQGRLYPCSRTKILLHPDENGPGLIRRHIRILKTGKPLAHQIRAFPPVRVFPLVDAAIVNRAGFSIDVGRPERFASGYFAARAFIFEMSATAAGISADVLERYPCHNFPLLSWPDKPHARTLKAKKLIHADNRNKAGCIQLSRIGQQQDASSAAASHNTCSEGPSEAPRTGC
jgi:hypothetical protein